MSNVSTTAGKVFDTSVKVFFKEGYGKTATPKKTKKAKPSPAQRYQQWVNLTGRKSVVRIVNWPEGSESVDYEPLRRALEAVTDEHEVKVLEHLGYIQGENNDRDVPWLAVWAGVEVPQILSKSEESFLRQLKKWHGGNKMHAFRKLQLEDTGMPESRRELLNHLDFFNAKYDATVRQEASHELDLETYQRWVRDEGRFYVPRSMPDEAYHAKYGSSWATRLGTLRQDDVRMRDFEALGYVSGEASDERLDYVGILSGRVDEPNVLTQNELSFLDMCKEIQGTNAWGEAFSQDSYKALKLWSARALEGRVPQSQVLAVAFLDVAEEFSRRAKLAEERTLTIVDKYKAWIEATGRNSVQNLIWPESIEPLDWENLKHLATSAIRLQSSGWEELLELGYRVGEASNKTTDWDVDYISVVLGTIKKPLLTARETNFLEGFLQYQEDGLPSVWTHVEKNHIYTHGKNPMEPRNVLLRNFKVYKKLEELRSITLISEESQQKYIEQYKSWQEATGRRALSQSTKSRLEELGLMGGLPWNVRSMTEVGSEETKTVLQELGYVAPADGLVAEDLDLVGLVEGRVTYGYLSAREEVAIKHLQGLRDWGNLTTLQRISIKSWVKAKLTKPQNPNLREALEAYKAHLKVGEDLVGQIQWVDGKSYISR